jgi:hypothetical protein
VLDIVVADRPMLAPPARVAQRPYGADRRHVVDGEDRGRQRIERQRLRRAATDVDGGAEHQLLGIWMRAASSAWR